MLKSFLDIYVLLISISILSILVAVFAEILDLEFWANIAIASLLSSQIVIFVAFILTAMFTGVKNDIHPDV